MLAGLAIFASRGFSVAAPQPGTHSHLTFTTLPLPIPFVTLLKLTASSRPLAPPSDSPKCLRFGHWLTLCTVNIHLLTYLLACLRFCCCKNVVKRWTDVYMCVYKCWDADVLSYSSLLPSSASLPLADAGHCSGRSRHVHLCVCRDWVQLSIHAQCLAPSHCPLHRLSAARQKTTAQRYADTASVSCLSILVLSVTVVPV